ncbi:MAG: GTPase ObgE [Acidimicrobiia bacterium]|nr:GTPase ObgE [Acidimicrobiia bacterium]
MSEFVDSVQLNVHAGKGGNGAMSFRREAHVPEGGPDGGDGGNGGSIIIQADHGCVSLFPYRDHPHVKAKNGGNGAGKKMHGKTGEDTIVKVPQGSIVTTFEGEPLADLINHGDKIIIARGGRGGKGNARFKNNTTKAPAFSEKGEDGDEFWLNLELKLMADVALVGFPNSGKSTLISSISAAKPKIADYPFTTLVPNLGVVKHGSHNFIVADIPGLIEGASEGKGLGFQFLKHIERARILVILLDLAAVDGVEPLEQEEKLLFELENYRPELLERPRLVIGSKSDVAGFDYDGIKISGVTRDGLDNFLNILGSMVEKAREDVPISESYVVHTPVAQGFRVEREGDKEFRIVGKSIERIISMHDLSNEEALSYIQQKFVKMGVEKAIRRAGVGIGDIVRVGNFEFEYSEGELL